MSDRTQLAFGRNSISVPKFTKRIVEVAVATGLTGVASFVILSLNNILVTTSGFMRGFEIWKSFIGRSDILGTMILTAMVTIAYIAWQRDNGPKR